MLNRKIKRQHIVQRTPDFKLKIFLELRHVVRSDAEVEFRLVDLEYLFELRDQFIEFGCHFYHLSPLT